MLTLIKWSLLVLLYCALGAICFGGSLILSYEALTNPEVPKFLTVCILFAPLTFCSLMGYFEHVKYQVTLESKKNGK